MLKRIALGLMLVLTPLLAAPLLAAEAESQVEHAAQAGAAGSTGQHGEAAAGEHGRKHELVEFDPTTAVWMIIVFVILLAILYPTAWKSVLAGLKAREDRIRKDIADAEAARAKADATLREYNTRLAEAEGRVRDMLTKATHDGEALAARIRASAQQEAEQTKDRATVEIEAAKKQALSEIYEQTADLATRVAEKILRRTLKPEDQQDLVRSSLEELEAAQK